MNEETLVTKGDANNTIDGAIEYSEVIGKNVTFRGKPLRIPKLGIISVLFNKNG